VKYQWPRESQWWSPGEHGKRECRDFTPLNEPVNEKTAVVTKSEQGWLSSHYKRKHLTVHDPIGPVLIIDTLQIHYSQ
jgi:hypothetical protein